MFLNTLGILLPTRKKKFSRCPNKSPKYFCNLTKQEVNISWTTFCMGKIIWLLVNSFGAENKVLVYFQFRDRLVEFCSIPLSLAPTSYPTLIICNAVTKKGKVMHIFSRKFLLLSRQVFVLEVSLWIANGVKFVRDRTAIQEKRGMFLENKQKRVQAQCCQGVNEELLSVAAHLYSSHSASIVRYHKGMK